jgi:aspartyl/asparaginyl-tRNA synthetase
MITEQNNTTKVKPLTTEIQKIDWLNKKIKNLEYLLENDSNIDAEDAECGLQMLRELLSIKMATCRANAVKKIKDNLCRDVAEFLKDFGSYLTDAEKMSIKSLICLRTKC